MDGSGVRLELAGEILMPAPAVRKSETEVPDRQIESKYRRRHKLQRNGQDDTQLPEQVEAAEHQLDDLA